ncbi:MAG: putative phage abortive infection protein [Chlorobiaceae bacterium]|nr:putative phage abortive infection protein [Chlorobiaceae bacterium]
MGIDFNKIAPESLDSLNVNSMGYYGLLGDYIGGFWGTIVGVLTLLVVLFTWRQTRNADYRAKIYQVFSEMLRTHEEIVSSMQLNGFNGRDVVSVFLSEFYAIYKVVKRLSDGNKVWTLDEKIDISYSYTVFGPHIVTENVLKLYNQGKISELSGLILKMRQDNQDPKKSYSGHQNRFSHYFRNLYAAYEFIENSKLTKKEKLSLAKVLRSKLSNYEQALLMLNVISHLGQEWERTGIFHKYKLIKNIPELFFTFDEDFELIKRFPYIDFEYEVNQKISTKIWSLSLGGNRFSFVRNVKNSFYK